MNRKAILLRRWPALTLAALTGLFFWNYFLFDETLYAGDTAFVLLPFRHFATSALGRGELPLWNPFLFGGTPALAEAQYQVFYPPNILLFVVGVARGNGWLLAVHVLFMALGSYAFARRSLGLSREAALLAAICFAFGGCIQSRLAVSVFTEAAAWLPWMMLWFDRARQRGGASLLLPGVALAMQVLTGAPQYAFYSLFLLLAYAVFCSLPRPQVLAAPLATPEAAEVPGPASRSGPLRRVWIALAATPVVGALLAAGQILPQWELARLSDRGTHASFDFATQFSLAPQHFLMAATLPKFYGLFSVAPRGGFAPGEETWYLGALALPLGLAALFGARWLDASRRRAAFFWGTTALLATGLALGRNNPLYHFLYDHVPGVAMFRAPARWLLVTSFSGAMLAGIGLDAAWRDRRVALAALGCALALAAATAAALLLPLGAQAGAQEGSPWLQVGLLGAVCALLGALWKLHGTPRAQALASVALVLGAGDLLALSNDMEVRHTLAVSAVEGPSPSAAALGPAGSSASASTSGVGGERFWPSDAPVPLEAWQTGSPQADARQVRGQGAAAVRALMISCIPAEFGAPGLTGAWGALMPLRRHPRAIYRAQTSQEERTRWLRMLNVRYYLSLRPLSAPGLSQTASEPLYVYRDDLALPRAFWVGQARPATIQNAESLVSAPGFDPRRAAVIESPNATSTSDASASSARAGGFAPARVVAARDSMLEIQVDAPRSGHMVVMDTPFPGWRATVDGRPAPILPANWVGRGVPVEAGSHQVRMWFEPQSVRLGVFVSMLALVFVAAGFAAGLKANSAQENSAPIGGRELEKHN